MKYNSYLKSEYWIERKEEFKESTYQRCFICRKKHAKFNVHHKRYKRKGRSILFHERDTDFRLLCGDCHKKIHQYNLEKVLCQMPVKRIILRDALKSDDPIKYLEAYSVERIVKFIEPYKKELAWIQ